METYNYSYLNNKIELKKKIRMSIIYPDGTTIKGKKNFVDWTDRLGITNFNFKNLSVLDVATDEGWWAFWAEMNGAKYVEASDVELGEDYDWGHKKDWGWINNLNIGRNGRKVFDFHHKNLNSKVVVKRESIYQASGNFDVVFAHGLMYHLRHPLLAIDNVAKICKGYFVFETFVYNKVDPMIATNNFYRTTELEPISNWSGATTACYTSWCKDAGFDDVYYLDQGFPGQNRQIFVAVKDTKYKQMFDQNSNLHYCDEKYWEDVFIKTRASGKSTRKEIE